jgi:hypothetical protein
LVMWLLMWVMLLSHKLSQWPMWLPPSYLAIPARVMG